jgi:hypothetical protein
MQPMDEPMNERRAGRVAALTRFPGVHVDDALYTGVAGAYLDMARAAVALSADAVSRGEMGLADRGLGVAMMASVGSLNALVSGVAAECTLAAPPVPITAGPDSSGRLIYRCGHGDAHRWDMAGNPLP